MAGARDIVRRAVVLGAGTMGSQIAALLASEGVRCDLLDLASEGGEGTRSRLAEEARRHLLELRPPPLDTPDALDLIRPGNFSDDLDRLERADWVIEAVAENLEIKRELWARAAPHLPAGAIASSNTSGIPIASIAEALPRGLRERFLGTHFFNPPRYLKLVEVIPTADTEPEVVDAISRFCEEVLGKGVVVAHDVPNFIANRVGCYGIMVTLRAAEEFGLGLDEVDAITGPAMGRPKSATFRTMDLVGIDVFVNVSDNMRGYARESWEREAFETPPYLRELVKRGWIGEKGGQGAFKRVKEAGETRILVLEPDTFEYRPRRLFDAPSLAAIEDVGQVEKRLRMLVGSDDRAGRFAWRVLSQTLVYAARMVGEVAADVASIDKAMRWGWGWDLGPFETWEGLGLPETVARMQADGLDVPGWVVGLADKGGSFYPRLES